MNNVTKLGTGVLTLAASAPWLALALIIIAVALTVWVVSDDRRTERWDVFARGGRLPTHQPPAPPRTRWARARHRRLWWRRRGPQ